MVKTKLVGAGLVAVAVAGCGAVSTPMEEAVSVCELEGAPGVRLGDGGESLTVSTRGEESKGVSTAELVCVLDVLEVPDHVSERMGTTRALDGNQSAQWDGMEGNWSYHPNTGLNFVVSVIN